MTADDIGSNGTGIFQVPSDDCVLIDDDRGGTWRVGFTVVAVHFLIPRRRCSAPNGSGIRIVIDHGFQSIRTPRRFRRKITCMSVTRPRRQWILNSGLNDTCRCIPLFYRVTVLTSIRVRHKLQGSVRIRPRGRSIGNTRAGHCVWGMSAVLFCWRQHDVSSGEVSVALNCRAFSQWPWAIDVTVHMRAGRRRRKYGGITVVFHFHFFAIAVGRRRMEGGTIRVSDFIVERGIRVGCVGSR